MGSTTTVGALLGAVEKPTVPRSLSLSAPSAVVIQTWAEAAGGAGAAVAGRVQSGRADRGDDHAGREQACRARCEQPALPGPPQRSH